MSILCLNQSVNSARSARLHTGRLKVNLEKKPKEDGLNSAVALSKNVRQLGCIFQDTERPESLSILRKSTSLGIISTSTVHKSFAASCKHPRKHGSVARKNSTQNSSSAHYLRHEM